MGTKIEILQASLKKKQAEFDAALAKHFEDVKSANGQPLNDKRNGGATLSRWDRQNERLRRLDESIKKTEQAIEREESLTRNVAGASFPAYLTPFLESGELTQWRKYPERFFVTGGGKSRLIWQPEKGVFAVSIDREGSKEEYAVFRDVVNRILGIHRAQCSEAS